MDKYLSSRGITPLRYDKKGVGSQEEVNCSDIVFICVNTPYDERKKQADLSYVKSAVSILTGKKIIVIRSTVPPGTTDSLQKEFPQHAFLFNPEFLRAKTAYKDFIKPTRQVVGYTEKSKKYAKKILDLLPAAPKKYSRLVSVKTAELLKYASNVMLSIKVAAANKFFDFCEALGVDYDDIKNLLMADPRIGSWGLDVMFENFRGYNGTCFPKDVRAFIALGEKIEVDMKWIEEMDDANLKLLKNQNLNPNYGHPKLK